MNLARLALKNAQSQFKTFFMYFLSMAFGVMVYYSFIAMSYDRHLMEQISQNNNLSGTLRAASVMILLFILVFMFSANSFFLKKRTHEIALYNILGMRKSQIGCLFFLENSLIGLGSLLAGLIGGIVLSKLFSMMLVRAMFLTIDNRFAFSLPAVKETAVTFLSILVVVSLRSAHLVYRYKLVDLLVARQKGDRYRKHSFLTTLTGLLGVACLVYGYYQAAHLLEYTFYLSELLQSDMGLIIAILVILFICIIGSYLIFHGFLPMLLSILQRGNHYYYRDIRMVTASSLRFHIRKNATTFGTIAVLLGTALSAIGGATDVYSYGMTIVNNDAPTDYIVNQGDYAELATIIETLPDYAMTTQLELSFKVVGGHYESQVFTEDKNIYTGAVTLLALSDYLKIEKVSPDLPSVQLDNEGQTILFERQMGNEAIKEQTIVKQVYLQDSSEPLQVIDFQGDLIGGGYSSRYPTPTFVVTDKRYRAQETENQYRLVFFNTQNSQESQPLVKQVTELFPLKTYSMPAEVHFSEGRVTGQIGPEEQVVVEGERQPNTLIRENISVRYPIVKENRINYGILVYTAVFLGVVFFIATGSLIMLKQLSEAEEERSRYQMLRKLGVSEVMIRQSVYKQNALVFFGPLLVATLHATFALKALGFMVGNGVSGLTWVARVIFILIYTAFYFGTSAAYNRRVNAS